MKETFITRANIETEALAPVGVAPAPNTHPGKDAKQNKVFKPVHTYHLGVWFNSVEAAAANGCPTNETAFNGDHTAGPRAQQRQLPGHRRGRCRISSRCEPHGR